MLQIRNGVVKLVSRHHVWCQFYYLKCITVSHFLYILLYVGDIASSIFYYYFLNQTTGYLYYSHHIHVCLFFCISMLYLTFPPGLFSYEKCPFYKPCPSWGSMRLRTRGRQTWYLATRRQSAHTVIAFQSLCITNCNNINNLAYNRYIKDMESMPQSWKHACNMVGLLNKNRVSCLCWLLWMYSITCKYTRCILDNCRPYIYPFCLSEHRILMEVASAYHGKYKFALTTEESTAESLP